MTEAESRSLRKFLKKDVVNAKTGEVLDGMKLRAMIDDEKLDAFKHLMGYYQIVSSELEMPSTEIIEVYQLGQEPPPAIPRRRSRPCACKA